MLRLALVLLVACDAGARDDVALKAATPAVPPAPLPPAPPPPAKPAVPAITYDLPPSAIAALTGCWRRDRHETWTFRADGQHGLVVVRELGDAMEAARARIPSRVSYEAKAATYGFGAAGRIHGLMMVFQLDKVLKAAVYATHDGTSYFWTGNNWTLKRC